MVFDIFKNPYNIESYYGQLTLSFREWNQDKEKEMVCSSSEQKSAVENISFQTSMVLVCCLLTRDPYRQLSSHQFPNLVITPR